MEDQEKEVSQAESQTPANTQNKGGEKGNLSFIVGAIVVIIIIVGAIFFFISEKDLDDTELLAMVNGEEVTRGDIQSTVEQIQTQYDAQGMDTSDPEIKGSLEQQALESYIQRKVILAYAEEMGIEVSQEELDERFDLLVSQMFENDEQLKQGLAEAGLTISDVKENLKESMIMEALAEMEGDMSVSEEQINERYALLLEQYDEQLPPLEDITDDIEQEIRNELMSQIIEALIPEIMDRYEVEIMNQEPAVEFEEGIPEEGMMEVEMDE